MNQNEQVLLELLKCSLNGGTPNLLPNLSWADICREAKYQTVVAVAEKALPDSLTEEEREPWKQALQRQYYNYLRYLAAEEELLSLFSEAAFPPVVIKGSAAATYYPEPSRRCMGDIDLLCRQSDFALFSQTLLENGYTQICMDDGMQNRETARHVEFRKDIFCVELHRCFSNENEVVERIIIAGLEHAASGLIDGHSFPMLPRLANGILLLEHMKKHLQSGMGLRQMLDWMMYVEAELDDGFWQSEFREAAEAAGLDTLAITSTRLCQMHLGLPETVSWCGQAEEEDCELLLESLLSSGNFGRKNGSKVEVVSTSIRRQGLLKRLQEAGEYNWKAYHRHPWLKPVCPVYQSFRYLRQLLSRERERREWKEEMARGKKRHEMLKKLKIE